MNIHWVKHCRLKTNSLGGQDGCKQENHLSENELLKKKKILCKNHRKGKKELTENFILTGQMMTTQHIKMLIVG